MVALRVVWSRSPVHSRPSRSFPFPCQDPPLGRRARGETHGEISWKGDSWHLIATESNGRKTEQTMTHILGAKYGGPGGRDKTLSLLPHQALLRAVGMERTTHLKASWGLGPCPLCP